MKRLFNRLQRTARFLFPQRHLFFATAAVLTVCAVALASMTATTQGVVIKSLPNIVLVHGPGRTAPVGAR